MRKTVSRLALALPLLALGCTGPTAAERATYDSIGPEYRRYVENDGSLDSLARQRRLDNEETWRLRVGAPRTVLPR